ncbi:reverse transcriptase-like protein [Alkalihalobacterium alkalinitrilicum]|uniref:reverse transcriptase-like protein n=1 Tax=Alkalihalobacterium alkalinitrilicum TaxID=427920 RepID=UPI0009956CA3|nr:reverse transcriptase-like protein [Alkalihalobacterium alkalinitrilicum]
MIEVYIDGASAGNPGPSGAGIYINYKDGNEDRYAIPLGELTNHEAEYMALIKALELCKEKGLTTVSFRTDSQLIDQAVEKRYVKKEQYQKLLDEALTYIDQFDLFFLKWIPSNQNKNADELSRQAVRKN